MSVIFYKTICKMMVNFCKTICKMMVFFCKIICKMRVKCWFFYIKKPHFTIIKCGFWGLNFLTIKLLISFANFDQLHPKILRYINNAHHDLLCCHECKRLNLLSFYLLQRFLYKRLLMLGKN